MFSHTHTHTRLFSTYLIHVEFPRSFILAFFLYFFLVSLSLSACLCSFARCAELSFYIVRVCSLHAIRLYAPHFKQADAFAYRKYIWHRHVISSRSTRICTDASIIDVLGKSSTLCQNLKAQQKRAGAHQRGAATSAQQCSLDER